MDHLIFLLPFSILLFNSRTFTQFDIALINVYSQFNILYSRLFVLGNLTLPYLLIQIIMLVIDGTHRIWVSCHSSSTLLNNELSPWAIILSVITSVWSKALDKVWKFWQNRTEMHFVRPIYLQKCTMLVCSYLNSISYYVYLS